MRVQTPRARSVIVALIVVLLGGCGGESPSEDDADTGRTPGSSPAEPYVGYPASITVLGHSQATGENTEPFEGGDTKTNTWATGTNPEVNSVYLRILEQNPEIEGHVSNHAEPSATIEMIGLQAETAVEEHPDLVLIQTLDADITCPATDSDYQAFGDGLSAVLDTLAEGSPATRVFIVTQYGSPETYAESLTAEQRRELGSRMGGPGPCAFVDEDGNLVREEVDRLEDVIVAYEKQLAEVCDAHANCEHDHGAFSEAAERPGDFTDDLDHLSVQGHARAAELAWAALQDVGLIPAT